MSWKANDLASWNGAKITSRSRKTLKIPLGTWNWSRRSRDPFSLISSQLWFWPPKRRLTSERGSRDIPVKPWACKGSDLWAIWTCILVELRRGRTRVSMLEDWLSVGGDIELLEQDKARTSAGWSNVAVSMSNLFWAWARISDAQFLLHDNPSSKLYGKIMIVEIWSKISEQDWKLWFLSLEDDALLLWVNRTKLCTWVFQQTFHQFGSFSIDFGAPNARWVFDGKLWHIRQNQHYELYFCLCGRKVGSEWERRSPNRPGKKRNVALNMNQSRNYKQVWRKWVTVIW